MLTDIHWKRSTSFTELRRSISLYIYIILPHSQATNSITNAMEYDPELRNAESSGGDALYVFLSLFIAWLAGLLQGSCKRYLG